MFRSPSAADAPAPPREPWLDRTVIALLAHIDPAVRARFDNPIYEAFSRWRQHHTQRRRLAAWLPAGRNAGIALAYLAGVALMLLAQRYRWLARDILPLLWNLFVVGMVIYQFALRKALRARTRLDTALHRAIAPGAESRQCVLDLWMTGTPADTFFDALYIEYRFAYALSVSRFCIAVAPLALVAPLVLRASLLPGAYLAAALWCALGAMWMFSVLGGRGAVVSTLHKIAPITALRTPADYVAHVFKTIFSFEFLTFLPVIILPGLIALLGRRVALRIIDAAGVSSGPGTVDHVLMYIGTYVLLATIFLLGVWVHNHLMIRRRLERARPTFVSNWESRVLERINELPAA